MDEQDSPKLYSNEELQKWEILIANYSSESVLGAHSHINDETASTNPLHQLTENLNCGHFEQVLQSDIARAALYVGDLDQCLKESGTLSAAIEGALRRYIDASSDDRIWRQWSTFLLGIASLELFIQNNWTGPASDLSLLACMSAAADSETNLHKDKVKQVVDCALADLCVDDCNIYPLVSTPELLLVAKCILVDCIKDIPSNYLTGDWWAVRCLWVWQQVLDEKAPSIYNLIIPFIQKVSDNDVLMCKKTHPDLCVTFHLECSHILHYYYDYQASKEHLQNAESITGLKVALTGALGKRTKWQSTNLPQLLLKVEKTIMSAGDASTTRHAVKGLPKDLALDDDTILNAIKLANPEEGEIPSLTAVEQALILALGVEKKRTMPKDALQGEELLPYVTTVLNWPQTWCVHMTALMMRSQLEKDKRRTVERAMMQMQSLIDQWKDEQCPVINRLKLFFATNLPSKWEMEKLLAGLFLALGSTSAALEVYLRLHLWEDAVGCYQRLDKLDKAQRLINEQLAKQETPLMLCLLGDVTQERKYYERAWEVSGQRSARAMKSLGLLCVHAEEYEKAIEYLEKSVEKNFLQYNAWFLLGYAAIKSCKYDVAVRAYQRCVTLENDNAEAWNNLSTSFIHLKDKRKAFRTLQEAIKCNYENWRIWENFMITSMDLGEFVDAIRSYNRLIEMRDKYVDEEVLGILVKAVCSDTLDANGNQAKDLHKKLVELFGHLTSKVTNNSQIWSLYGQLHGNGQSDDPQANDKALQCLQKCHRLCSQSDEWLKDVNQCKEVLEQSQQLAQVYMRTSQSKDNTGEAIQMLSSAKLMIKAIVNKVKKQQEELQVYTSAWAEVTEPLMLLENTLETIIQQIALRKGQSS